MVCLRYDYTCCSRMKARHLPFSCEFNDNETLASYANGIHDYYDVEQIEEFVAFKGAYEIESLIEKNEHCDDISMRIIIRMLILMNLLRKSLVSKKRLMFCRNLWKKKLMML